MSKWWGIYFLGSVDKPGAVRSDTFKTPKKWKLFIAKIRFMNLRFTPESEVLICLKLNVRNMSSITMLTT